MSGSLREYRWRRRVVLTLFMLAVTSLLWRSLDMQVLRKDFYQREGNARSLRTVTVVAHRGKILDRNGQALAVSTPVDSVWFNPQELDIESPVLPQVVKLLGLDSARIERLVRSHSNRQFVYLKRQIPPALAVRVKTLELPGIYLQREYRRYYPAAAVTGHLVGFTNVDEHGQEGIELAFNDTLRGVNGAEQVLLDRKGQQVESVRAIKTVRAGEDVVLSLDRRVQYFAYRALLKAVKQHRAKSATAVVLDIHSGEVLAMVNYPTYNPNKSGDRVSARFRNRAVTDVFEPGSTAKLFTVAAALESGQFSLESLIDTTPGIFKVAGHTVRDSRNYGRINLQTLVKKSSNVGASKLSLAIPPQILWKTLTRFGFGQTLDSGFPGESAGVLPHYFDWKTIHRVTLSFGYGLSVTTLQLAAAYAAIANDGVLPEVTFLRRERSVKGLRVISSGTSRQLQRMLESVTQEGGTGTRAVVHGYRVGGKTGTVRKLESGVYSDKKYLALFSGIVPMSAPRLAIVVTVDNPGGKVYYGGQVAAPVFSEIAAGSLRVLGIPPDSPRLVPAKRQERLAGLSRPRTGVAQ